mmetsp:Transcript_9969/g.14908  ORF Transcript_9969/g.14908 Transcript_9969/m.14908 type:complete len:492 (-) Transcript_9969:78-1553(-)
MVVKNPFKAESGIRRFLSPTKARRLSLCIIIAVAIGAIGLLFLDNKQGKKYLKPSTSIQKKSNDNIILASSNGTTDIQHRPSKQGGDAVGSNKEEDGEEPQLNAAVDEFETTDTMKASPSNNGNPTDDMSMEIEQKSRAYPIWIDKRRAVDNNSRPYDWFVSEDLPTNDKDPKGLLFVKVLKCSSSTGAGVTLRIQDGLSKRLNQPNPNKSQAAHAPGSCMSNQHATAGELRFHKRDPSQSFLWSIVREPAQRTLSHYFYFDVSSRNDTATEDGIMAVLKFPTHPRPWHPQHNYQSKYLDLPSQNEQSSSSTERIINGYDFVAVSDRMEESLVVLAMLAQIPLTDVVVFSSKIAGGYDGGNGRSCVKLKKKWTTPKIDEYIHGDYQSANKDDYLLYNAAQRSLDKTIDALGRKRVEENVELLKSLQQQNDEQCASKTTMPCPQPKDESMKEEHKRLAKESCYKDDFGCGHACTDEVLADYAAKEWTSITSS